MGWNDAPDYTPQGKRVWPYALIAIAVPALPVLLWIVFDVWLNAFPASRS